MTKKKPESPVADTIKEMIASKPDGTITAVTDLALWSSCIIVAHTAIVTFDKANNWIKDNPIAAWQLVPIFTPFIFLLPPPSGDTTKPLIDLGSDDWKWALIIGTLAFGTLKYAGNGIVDGMSGAIGSALKVVGITL